MVEAVQIGALLFSIIALWLAISILLGVVTSPVNDQGQPKEVVVSSSEYNQSRYDWDKWIARVQIDGWTREVSFGRTRDEAEKEVKRSYEAKLAEKETEQSTVWRLEKTDTK